MQIIFSYSNYSRQDDLSSSVVVIPHMQICPGDLLVYSRVLTHKASGYGETYYYSFAKIKFVFQNNLLNRV